MTRSAGPMFGSLLAAVLLLGACSSGAHDDGARTGSTGASTTGSTGASAGTGGSASADITSLPRPVEGSPEAGFVRDMSVHHAQAVAMAEAIRDRTADPELKLLATDIALGQQGQIGRMSGWLDEWGLNPTSTATPMAWIRADNLLPGIDATMTSTVGNTVGNSTVGTSTATMGNMAGMSGGDTGGMSLGDDGRMPGMATRPQVSALSTLPIADAEVSFLQLMIAHHAAGVEMGKAILARSTRPDVVRLATSIVEGQQAEIAVMTDMLAKRGATP